MSAVVWRLSGRPSVWRNWARGTPDPCWGPGGVGRLMSFPSLGSRSAPGEKGNGDLFLIPRFPLSRCLFSRPPG